MKEKIVNVPDEITALRIIITLIIIYGAFANFSLLTIAILFCVGAITDFFDGFYARKLHEKTEFGRKFDIIADRFLMISTVVVVVFLLFSKDLISNSHLLQILMIMSREIITAPFAVISLIRKRAIPHAKFIGKLMTTCQGFASRAQAASV